MLIIKIRLPSCNRNEDKLFNHISVELKLLFVKSLANGNIWHSSLKNKSLNSIPLTEIFKSK